MKDEREPDPSAEDPAGTTREPETTEEDAPGRVQSVEWTTSTYRSSRKTTDVPRKPAKTKVPRAGSPARPAPGEDDA